MFCEKCGKEIKDNVKFCPFCGNKVSGKSGIPPGGAKANFKRN